MGTTADRWTRVALLFACVACGRVDAPESNVRGVRDVDAGEAADLAVPDAPDYAALWQKEPLFRSGGRLRARVLDAGGGALAFQGFRDTALDASCAYELAEDGEHRCLPTNGAEWVYYRDPHCREPVWFGFDDEGVCAEPRTAFALEGLPSNAECNEAYRTRVYRIGALLPDTRVYTVGFDGCGLVDAPACVREVEHVPPEQFVQGEARLEPIEDGVSIHWAEYADGARFVRGLVDSTRGSACRVEPKLAAARCVPTSTAHVFLDGAHGGGVLYADASCGGAYVALDFSREACAVADMGIVWREETCDRYEYILYELGAELASAYSLEESRCAAVAAAQGSWFYELGPLLDVDALPELVPARAGSGRLRASYFASAAGRPLQSDGYFYDVALQRECVAQRMADDSVRCAPPVQDAFVDPAGPFADRECRHRLVVVTARPDGCSRTPSVATQSTPGVNRPSAFYEVGARFDPPDGRVYFSAGRECRERVVAAAESFYELGAELDLARVEDRVE